MKCKHCGCKLEEMGFSRRLITRGKNKGQSVVEIFYRECACHKTQEKK